MTQQSIYISDQGELLLIDAPEKSSYIDFKNVDNEGRSRYEAALASAIKEGIKFKDELHVKLYCDSLHRGNSFPRAKIELPVGQTFPLPTGYKVSFEDDCTLNECNCPNPAKKGHVKLAILSKLEEERPLFFTGSLCDMHQRPACEPNERVDCKCEWIAFERSKVVAPSEEVKLTYIVFKKSVMNMYEIEEHAMKLADELNKKNVNPDENYVVEKVKF